MTTTELTDRQREILDYMKEHIRIRYPTIREIAEYFDVQPATIHDHIQALRRKGYLPEYRTKIGN